MKLKWPVVSFRTSEKANVIWRHPLASLS